MVVWLQVLCMTWWQPVYLIRFVINSQWNLTWINLGAKIEVRRYKWSVRWPKYRPLIDLCVKPVNSWMKMCNSGVCHSLVLPAWLVNHTLPWVLHDRVVVVGSVQVVGAYSPEIWLHPCKKSKGLIASCFLWWNNQRFAHTHLGWRSETECEHAGLCQTESVHGQSPGHGAARVGWSEWKHSPDGSKTLSGFPLDAPRRRNSWKRREQWHNCREAAVWKLDSWCGAHPDRDLMSTKSRCRFNGVKRMQVDLAKERRPWVMMFLSLVAS